MKPQRALRRFAPRDLRARRRAFRPAGAPDRLPPLQGLFAAGTVARLGAAALGWVLLGRRRSVEAA